MGFLSWWADNKSEESATQLDLLDKSQAITPQRKRVDGATVNQRFNKAIRDCGGGKLAHRDSVIAETQELFDCSVRELYQKVGGKVGDRSTLPVEAQEAYIVSEALAAHDLYASQESDQSQSQEESDARIVETVRVTARDVRKRWLPW
jgi:hypothetical protein